MNLPGTICIRCGFEPLEGVAGEWWCPECWSSGFIIRPKASEEPDQLLADCRAIVQTQRSQLRALRRGEQLGEASILGSTKLAEHFVRKTEERDDRAPWERPEYYTGLFNEWDAQLRPPSKASWVARRHPELAWLDQLEDKTFYRLPDSQASLRKFFPWISEVEWRVLLA